MSLKISPLKVDNTISLLAKDLLLQELSTSGSTNPVPS